jgi:hypothetical protein
MRQRLISRKALTTHLTGGKVNNISKLWKEADAQGRKVAIPYASPYAFAAEVIGGLLRNSRDCT